jgi:hypothetical protein
MAMQMTGGTMKRTLLLAVLCLAGLSGAAATAVATSPTTKPSVPQHASKYPVIVHIVSRDHTVTISAGPKGPVYSMTGSDGSVMIADASGPEFAKLQPEIYQHLRNSMAVQADATDAVPYAGIGGE